MNNLRVRAIAVDYYYIHYYYDSYELGIIRDKCNNERVKLSTNLRSYSEQCIVALLSPATDYRLVTVGLQKCDICQITSNNILPARVFWESNQTRIAALLSVIYTVNIRRATQLSANAAVTFPSSITYAARVLFIWTATARGIQSAVSVIYSVLLQQEKFAIKCQIPSISPRLMVLLVVGGLLACHIFCQRRELKLMPNNSKMKGLPSTTELQIWTINYI